MFAKRKGDVVGNRHAVEEGGALEDKAIAGAEVGQIAFPHGGERLAFEPHLSLGGPYEADHRLQQHGLAAAAFAEHHERLAGRDVERDVPQHLLLPELHGEPFDLEQGWLGLIAAGCRQGGGGGHGGVGWRGGLQRSRRGPSGRKKSCTLLSQIPRNRSSSRISTKEWTKALVADLPTPSAPWPQWKP